MGKRRQRTLLYAAAVLGMMILGQLGAAIRALPLKTAVVGVYDGRKEYEAEGIVIRRELATELEEPEHWRLSLEPGQRAAAGQVLLRKDPEPETLTRRLRLLQAGLTARAMALPRRRQAIHDAVRALNAASGQERIPAAEGLASLLLGEGGGLTRQIEDTRTLLARQSPRDAEAIRAPAAGWFVLGVDGLEEILTPEDPWARYSLPRREIDEGAGARLVLGETWYVRMAMPFPMEPGQRVAGRLPRGTDVTLTVEEIRDGMALLSCGDALEEIAALRTVSLRLRKKEKTGLEIPRKAVYTVNGIQGVWRIGSGPAEFLPVEVLLERDDSLVVSASEDASGLRPGDLLRLRIWPECFTPSR